MSENRRMKTYITLILLTIFYLATGCVATRNPQQRTALKLQRGKITEDTSYLYSLPYKEGEKFLLVQGYFSILSHKNRAALDFKMKKGTPITAARNGVVTRVKQDGKKGGWSRKYRQDGNMIIIQHEDGSRAGYWHLQHNGALVNVGDTVEQGQEIGLSGKTGLALFPHLHFLVWTNRDGQWKQVPTRFNTSKGDRYLKPFRFFKRPVSEKEYFSSR